MCRKSGIAKNLRDSADLSMAIWEERESKERGCDDFFA